MRGLNYTIKISLLFSFLTAITYAACVGPYCYDDTGAHINGQLQLQSVKYANNSVQVSSPSASGGSTSPASPSNSIQFNNSGSFGGNASILYGGVGQIKFVNNNDLIDLLDSNNSEMAYMNIQNADDQLFLVTKYGDIAIIPSISTGSVIITNSLAGSLGRTDAILAIESATKGVSLPIVTTTNRNAITSPSEGLFIFNTSSHTLEYYNGTAWRAVNSSAVN